MTCYYDGQHSKIPTDCLLAPVPYPQNHTELDIPAFTAATLHGGKYFTRSANCHPTHDDAITQRVQRSFADARQAIVTNLCFNCHQRRPVRGCSFVHIITDATIDRMLIMSSRANSTTPDNKQTTGQKQRSNTSFTFEILFQFVLILFQFLLSMF